MMRGSLMVFFVCLSFSWSSAMAESLETHPRPDWARPWISLNGSWQFEFDPEGKGIEEEWFKGHEYSRTIEVPYPWQSRLSRVHDTEYQGAAWYRREVAIPKDLPGSRIFLVFGAVDWHATVWAGNRLVAEHDEGYTPFEVELTDVAKRGETVTVTVRAFDATDPTAPTGKQIGWYTRTGGIWQTVYIEGRGASYLRNVQILPDIDQERATLRGNLDAASAGVYTIGLAVTEGARRYTHSQDVQCAAGNNAFELTIDLPEPALWSPDSPALYQAELSLRNEGAVEDLVHTYFGMRKISRGTYGGSEHEYILLNNKPIYLRGALHQSFNPDGIHTHPDDAYIRRDYEKAKEFGLNFIRIHIKVDEPRVLYWADRLGVLLMCDVPNFWRKGPQSRSWWEATMRGMIARDFNHPSIFSWCLFNETWGIGHGEYDRETQEWVRDKVLEAKALDPTRLVEDNSANRRDHTLTDINSWHFYIDRFKSASRHIARTVERIFPGSEFNYAEGWKQDTAPLINSEYGGVSAGSGDRDISWVFLFLTNLLRKYDKIGGYVYTELEDIEWEHNGFMNYDRSDKEYHYPAGITLAELQRDIFPVLDCPPYQRVKPGDRISIPVILSHWSERTDVTLRLSAHGATVDGREWSQWIKPKEQVISPKPYASTPQGSFDFKAPKASGLLFALAEIFVDGERYAANYCVIDVRGGGAWNGRREFGASFPVDAFAQFTFAEGSGRAEESDDAGTHEGKVFGYGSGAITYRLQLPEGLDGDDVIGCRLIAEIGSKAGVERLDWPQRSHPQDYPQTDGKTWPSDIVISIDGEKLGAFTAANDFADARGVLSHVAHYHHGSHGERVDLPFEGKALEALKLALDKGQPIDLTFEVPEDARHKGGLALYGDTMGAYPDDPTFVFTLAKGARKPKGSLRPLDAQHAAD